MVESIFKWVFLFASAWAFIFAYGMAEDLIRQWRRGRRSTKERSVPGISLRGVTHFDACYAPGAKIIIKREGASGTGGEYKQVLTRYAPGAAAR